MNMFALIIIVLSVAKKLVQETMELLAVVRLALRDKVVTKDELLQIIKEAEDVGQIIVEIGLLVARK